MNITRIGSVAAIAIASTLVLASCAGASEGGEGSSDLTGTLIGAGILVSATDYFALRGELSPGLYGMLIIVVTLVARGGVVGLATSLLARLRGQHPDGSPKLSRAQPEGGGV